MSIMAIVALIVVTVVSLSSGLGAPVLASEQAGNLAAVPTDPAATPEAISTATPELSVSLFAGEECASDGSVRTLLTFSVTAGPLTVTDVIALKPDGTTIPVVLELPLPATLPSETTVWSWQLDVPVDDLSPITPISLLARFPDLPGDPTANEIVPDERGGWYGTAVTPSASACSAPTPDVTETPAENRTPDVTETPEENASPEPSDTPITDEDQVMPEATPEPEEVDITPEATQEPEEAETFPTPASFVDTPPAAIVDEAPAAATPVADESVPLPSDTVTVIGRTGNETIRPGESARYRFRVTNTLDRPVVARLVSSESAAGWRSMIADATGDTVLAGDIHLEAGESIYVIVVVFAPGDAPPGSQNVTTLDAADVRTAD